MKHVRTLKKMVLEAIEDRCWKRVNTCYLNKRELELLLVELEGSAPRRLRGDGLDTYEDFAELHEISDNNQFDAIRLVEKARLALELISVGTAEGPFAEAIQEAVSALKDEGIDYEGWGATYVYLCPTQDAWRQIPKKRAAIIYKRRMELEHEQFEDRSGKFLARNGDPHLNDRLRPAFVEWRSKYPWRQLIPLSRIHEERRVEPNSRLWHALKILDNYQAFRRQMRSQLGRIKNHKYQLLYIREVRAKGGRDEAKARNAISFAQLGYDIGRAHEALRKKKYEVEALKHIRRRKDAARGGKEKAKSFSRERTFLYETVQNARDLEIKPAVTLRRIAAQNLGSKSYNHESAKHKREFERIRKMYNREKEKRDATIKSH